MTDLVQEWLNECRAPKTKVTFANRIKLFQKWYGKPLSDFLKLAPKERRHLAISYQNETLRDGMKQNSVSGVMGALGSFCSFHDVPLGLRGKRVRAQMDLTSHNFSSVDLTRMFEVANVEEKALLATFLSLGWERSSFNILGRQRLEAYVLKAKETSSDFMYFLDQRPKTGVARLGVLNPLALEWLGQWFKMWKGKTPFAIKTEDGMNKMLKRLVREAQVTVTGRVHTHSLRKWVMSGLSRAGFNEFQIKFVVGKAIPTSDATYLLSLQREVEERYPVAYENYLNIYSRGMADKSRMAELERKYDELKKGLDEIVRDSRVYPFSPYRMELKKARREKKG